MINDQQLHPKENTWGGKKSPADRLAKYRPRSADIVNITQT